MIKQATLLIMLLIGLSAQGMLYDEDESAFYLMGTLTQPGERYPLGIVKRKKSIPLKNVVANKDKNPDKEENRTSCLSILEFLLQQYKYALPNSFAVTL